jgi:hypothetical protein
MVVRTRNGEDEDQPQIPPQEPLDTPEDPPDRGRNTVQIFCADEQEGVNASCDTYEVIDGQDCSSIGPTYFECDPIPTPSPPPSTRGLTITAQGNGKVIGQVLGVLFTGAEGFEIDVGPNQTQNYNVVVGQTLGINVIAGDNSKFVKFIQNGFDVTSENLNITLVEPTNITAIFEDEDDQTDGPGLSSETFTVQVDVGGNRFGSAVTIDNEPPTLRVIKRGVRGGTNITISAIEVDPNVTQFVQWINTDTGEFFSDVAEQTFTIQTNLNLTAEFIRRPSSGGGGGGTSVPTPTPTPTPPPPTPTPTPLPQWRDCLDGKLKTGNPPADFIGRRYPGPSGGICWEPDSFIGFVPALDEISFNYQRGSSLFPDSFEFQVNNPSSAISYKLTFETNFTLFEISPRQLVIGPREVSQRVGVSINKENIQQFGDGTTDFDFRIKVEEI